MNADDRNLDELISGAISRDEPQFDFDKWRQTYRKEIDVFQSQKEPPKTKPVAFEPNIQRTIFLSKVGYAAAALLVFSSLVACFVLSGKIDDLRKDVVAQHASASPSEPQPAQMRVNQHDILYYESFDDEPEYMRPGIILRGPSSRHQIDSSEAPVISNGHTLALSEARRTADFELHTPARLFPGYSLDQIRRIEGHDAMQLLYTDGINSVSLFEQPLDVHSRLEPKDFREYAVYQNKGQARRTILAWRDNALSYVLIGNIEMSQLMNMARAISAGK
jgi:hypothetical protein